MQDHDLQLLIVDDDDVTRDLVERLVRRAYPHAQVFAYASSLKVLQRIQSGHVDLLITNCHMPDMDGPTLVRSLREQKFSLPILMISGSPEAHALGAKAGIDGFIDKHMLVVNLHKAMRDLLETR